MILEVYGKEWSFGKKKVPGSGVFFNEPKKCPMHTYHESVLLGETKVSEDGVNAIIKDMSLVWLGETYDLLHRNCCSFGKAFAARLGQEVPHWISRLAELGAFLDDEYAATAKELHHLHEIEEHLVDQTVAHFRKDGKVSLDEPAFSCACKDYLRREREGKSEMIHSARSNDVKVMPER